MTPNASPMGQVYLGFRSLLLRIAVFVVMAALLAWALGGTLWPRTVVRVIGTPVVVDGSMIGLVDQIGAERSTFGLATLDPRGDVLEAWPSPESDGPTWHDALTPVATPGGVAGGAAARIGDQWTVWIFQNGERHLQGGELQCFEVENRLAAAELLDRAARGLDVSVQSPVEGDERSAAGADVDSSAG